MQIDTAGTYTLKYTAEDECGNVTEVTREVVAEQISYRTVLYTDGTFIINEKSTDRAANIALHGAVTNEYIPFDPNGTNRIDRYDFNRPGDTPWFLERASIINVFIGSVISPVKTSYWFSTLLNCVNIDVRNLDTSATRDALSMFNYCPALTTLDLSSLDTRSMTTMSNMFYTCENLTTLDISSFDTSAVTQMDSMFYSCKKLQTIYASALFDVTNVVSSGAMFYRMSTDLVGGAGTRWSSSNPTDKTYAHIDGGTSNPGYFTLKSA